MRSTGEVMGIAETFALAMGKAMTASGSIIVVPGPGDERRRDSSSVKDEDKPAIVHIARRLRPRFPRLVATSGTAPRSPAPACRRRSSKR